MRLVRGGFVMAFVCAAGAAGAACSAFSSDEPVSAPSEAGADTSVVPSNDGDVGDGGIDAADASPMVDPGPFCASVDAQFCWSFDSVTQALLGPRLTTQKTADPPTVVATGLSAPNAMAVALSTAGNVGVDLDLATDVSHLRCDFDVIFDGSDSGANDQLAFVQLDYVGSGFRLPVLRARRTDPGTLRASLDFGGSPVDLGNVPTGQWTHAYIDTDVVGGMWRVRAQVLTNGEETLDAGARASLPRFNRIFFGLATFAATFDWQARFDNLVCVWQ